MASMSETPPPAADSTDLRERREQITYYLSPTSTVPERLQGLLDCGLTRADIALAVGVESEEAVRLWQNGSRKLKGRRYASLDVLRYVALCLLERGLEPERVSAWFRGRNEALGDATPLSRFDAEPEGILAVGLRDAGRAQRRSKKQSRDSGRPAGHLSTVR